MFAPGELLKFCTPKPVVFVPPVPEGIACHWMPNSAALVEAISTISASTNTCARRASSFSITPRRPLYTASGAMMTSELVSGYACTEASASAPMAGAAPAPPGAVASAVGGAPGGAGGGVGWPNAAVGDRPGAAARVAVGWPEMMARSASASRSAWAFLR